MLQPKAQLPTKQAQAQTHPPAAQGETSVLHGDTQHAAIMTIDVNER